ncbi:MAG: choice-of-anchor D domain-containing protein [Candidatus Sulfotelmatobacter sp.]
MQKFFRLAFCLQFTLAIAVMGGWGAEPLTAQSYSVTPTSIAFAKTTVGLTSNCNEIVITNTGTTTLTINSFSLTPFGVFRLNYGYAPGTVPAKGRQTFCVDFAPAAAQAYSGNFTVNVQGASPTVVPLTGTGVATTAVASVSPNVLSFAPQALGTTMSQTVTVTNTGKAPFHVSSVTALPPFGVSGFTPKTAIQPKKSYSFQITFDPSQSGSYTNTVLVGYDLVPGQGVSVTGTGTNPSALSITSYPVLPPGTIGFPYSYPLAAASGSGALTWTVLSGSLPTGLSLSTAGAISGQIGSTVTAGNYAFTAQVQDAALNTSTVSFTLPVAVTTGAPRCQNTSWDIPGTSNPLIPWTDLGTGSYEGVEGGLYPGGSNTPPTAQETAAVAAAQGIQPRDLDGTVDTVNGKYVFMSIGVSITHTIWDEFQPAEALDPATNSHMVLVNAAIDGTNSPNWTSPTAGTYQTILNYFLPYQNVSAQQVAVAWIMMPHSNPAGTFPTDMNTQENDLIAVVQNLHTYFPNLALAYITSNSYAGYQGTRGSYPETYSYEFGYAAQTVIADQINGQANLNWNPNNGPVKAPLLLWGPYTWTNGMIPRSDGLVWTCQDVTNDGLHPSASGRNKEAAALITFMKTDPTATPWFLHP